MPIGDDENSMAVYQICVTAELITHTYNSHRNGRPEVNKQKTHLNMNAKVIRIYYVRGWIKLDKKKHR